MMEHLKNNPYELMSWEIIRCKQRIEDMEKSFSKGFTEYFTSDLVNQKERLKKAEAAILIIAEEMPECLI